SARPRARPCAGATTRTRAALAHVLREGQRGLQRSGHAPRLLRRAAASRPAFGPPAARGAILLLLGYRTVVRRIVLALALVILVAGAASASDTELSGREGHPRERLPLAVWAESFNDAALDGAVRRALDDW